MVARRDRGKSMYTNMVEIGNVGFIFTNGDLKVIRDKILANKVAAPARAGAVAPGDVYVPAGNTGMEPGKTSFFQALGVPTKIARGTIEITTDLKLVEAGAKVGASEATLLNMLNISPFTYGMKVQQVYEDGNAFSPDVLDVEESQLFKALNSAIATITAVSLAANYPTLPSIIHSLINGYKKVIAVAIEIDYSWPAIDELKDRIANPDAYAAAAPTAAATTDAAPAAEAAKEEEKEEEEKEESEDEGKPDFLSNSKGHLPNSTQVSVVSLTKRIAQASLHPVKLHDLSPVAKVAPKYTNQANQYRLPNQKILRDLPPSCFTSAQPKLREHISSETNGMFNSSIFSCSDKT